MNALIIILVIMGIITFISFIIFALISEKNKKTLKVEQINFFKNEANNVIHFKQNYFSISQNTNNTKTWNDIKNTKYQRGLEVSSGIYAIFIPVENINEIIPIYVGQSKDIFKRWKSHQNQIEKIIKEESNTRTYKKIVTYLKQKNLNIQSLNFIVLEKCNEENLNERELYYINILGSDVYGFNATKGNKN